MYKNKRQLKSMLKYSLAVIGLSKGLDLKRSATELTIANQMDLGIELQRKCCRTTQDQVILFSVVPVPWRGNLRSKGSGKKSINFNGSTKNIKLLLQMVISVNQLSLYGAVADMIEELPVGQRAPVKPAASGQLDKQQILTQPPLAEVQANEERQGNLCRFEISRSWTILLCSSVTKRKRKSMFMPRKYVASRSRRNSQKKDGSKAMRDLAQSRTSKFAINTEGTVLKFRFNLCFKIKPCLGFEL